MRRRLANESRLHRPRLGRVMLLLAGLALAGLVGAFTLRPSTEAYPTLAARAGPPTPGQLTVRFLGTSTLAFDDGRDVVLIDGYLSRPGVLALLTRPLHPDQAAIARHLKRADIRRVSALYVAHTHFDHALDSASLARTYGGALHGTDTLAAIAAAEGVEGPVLRLTSGQPTAVGAFQVTPFSTPHSPGDVAAGATAAAFRFPARARAYPEGGAHSFLIEHGTCRILVVPSAGHPGDRFHGVHADVVMLGVGQLSRQSPEAVAAYWRDTVTATGARLVIPIHWDDFSRSLDQPLRPFPYAVDRFDQTMKQLTALAGDQVALRLPRAFERMDWSGLPVGGCA
ncbi:metal-dependent hydrolase [compost metagenome]